jgi:hypothetical protein
MCWPSKPWNERDCRNIAGYGLEGKLYYLDLGGRKPQLTLIYRASSMGLHSHQDGHIWHGYCSTYSPIFVRIEIVSPLIESVPELNL